MADDKSKTGEPDRQRINTSEPYEALSERQGKAVMLMQLPLWRRALPA